MAANLLAPNGLSFARNRLSSAGDYAANKFSIKRGYASNIGRGDLVKTGTSSSQGYVVLADTVDTSMLGVFVAVLPYYDQSLQGLGHGLNGAYQSTANPPTGVDVECLVVDDPFATFIAQVNGGVWANSWRGQNINFASGSNGAPNASGQSTLVLDYASLNTTSNLPFRIVGPAGVVGGPQDPNNTYPWIEVRLNTAELLNPTGI